MGPLRLWEPAPIPSIMEYKVRNWTRGGGTRCRTLEEALADLEPPLVQPGDEWEIMSYETPTSFGTIVARGRGPITRTEMANLVN